MKVLFVTSEHPSHIMGGLGVFSREYVSKLKEYCEVKVVLISINRNDNLKPDAYVDYVIFPHFKYMAVQTEACALENAASIRTQLEPLLAKFAPDIIHCNDRQTFLPFRFDKNVVYSSHLLFTDMLSLQSLDDEYFVEHKIERCALLNSAAVIVYSQFAANRAQKMVSSKISPIVLPLGFNKESFYANKVQNKMKITYFGRFENMQKGFLDFLHAINLLGYEFIKKYNIEISLYGKGAISQSEDISLIKNIGFIEGDELYKAYAESDIVVMPSKYEPFGLVGLEAMASGCLLMPSKGVGMDEYAIDGKNCISIPSDARGIAKKIAKVVQNFSMYKNIIQAGRQTVKVWTWERSVNAHLFVYKQIIARRKKNLDTAYASTMTKVIQTYGASPIKEKITQKKKNIRFLKSNIDLKTINTSLILTTECLTHESTFTKATIVSVVNKNEDSIIIRPECLPYADNEFTNVYVAGIFETVLNPKLALKELFRVASKSIAVLVNTENKLSWQTFLIEQKRDWVELQGSLNSEWRIVKNTGNSVTWKNETFLKPELDNNG
ncbi:MAG: hypothetical protein BKP49_05520 [Treponema sp. CETP13]|nr:MAG: hypothetical protein BKP49_05520 [Treponema sp. CETP13]